MQAILPSIHLNGTSAAALADDAKRAMRAASAALTEAHHAAPNARDYYPQGELAFREAMAQHEAIVAAIRLVLAHFTAHYLHATMEVDRRRGVERVAELPSAPLGDRPDPSEMANTSESMKPVRLAPAPDDGRGFVNCPTCNRFTASVRGEACGDCHHKPIVVGVEKYDHTFEAKLTLATGDVVISRDGIDAGKGRWDAKHDRITDATMALHQLPLCSDGVYEALDQSLRRAVADLQSRGIWGPAV